MLSWIQDRKWLPEITLSAIAILIIGGLDLATQGFTGYGLASFLALAFLFIRNFQFLIPVLLLTLSILQIFLGVLPFTSNILLPVIAFSIGAFSIRPWREIGLASVLISGILSVGNAIFNESVKQSIASFTGASESSRIRLFVFAVLFVLSVNLFAWILGILLMTRMTHVGTSYDRIVSGNRQAKLAIELAEQTERFAIAKDINELVVQQISAVVSQAEGGIYAGKNDPDAGARALERILYSAREAQTELRRLFDMLNRGKVSASAPPKLEDLEALATNFRGMNLDVTVSNFGKRFDLSPGAELALYRIIFDALQNVRQHSPGGTSATVEISWADTGVQVLIKDNGVEILRKNTLGLEVVDEGYTALDDLESLVEQVTGPGITAMRERAQTYGGSLEVARVPGVGFTVSAIFPDIQIRLQENQIS